MIKIGVFNNSNAYEDMDCSRGRIPAQKIITRKNVLNAEVNVEDDEQKVNDKVDKTVCAIK